MGGGYGDRGFNAKRHEGWRENGTVMGGELRRWDEEIPPEGSDDDGRTLLSQTSQTREENQIRQP